MKWFVNIAGKTTGPHEEDEVRAMAQTDALRGAQVRDETGSQWMAAEKSPFRPLMRERSWVGPIVASLVAWFALKLLTFAIVSGSGARDAVAGSTMLATIGAIVVFAVLALLRRL